MRKNIKYHIWSRDIAFGEKLQLLLNYTDKKEYKMKQNAQNPPNSFNIVENKYNDYYTGFFDEFIELLENIPYFERFWFTIHLLKNNDEDQFIIINFNYDKSSIDVSVQSLDNDMVEITHDFICDNFGLGNPIIPTDDDTRAYYPNPTVFVGRHFDLNSENKFNKLSEFLTLLGFEVKQGDDYASMDIPQKVKTRIDNQDIFIALITGNRVHDWIISEFSYALGRDKHVILLVEDGLDFNPTILGTELEQIRFPSECLEKIFVKLIREFNSIRVKGIIN